MEAGHMVPDPFLGPEQEVKPYADDAIAKRGNAPTEETIKQIIWLSYEEAMQLDQMETWTAKAAQRVMTLFSDQHPEI